MQAPRKVLALAVGVLVAGFFDYAVKQTYIRLRNKPPANYEWSLRTGHPRFHHGLKPNAAGIDTYGRYSAPTFSNSLGLRDAEVREVALRSDRPRILFIGDSFTEAAGLPWEKSFVGRIWRSLKDQGIEVLNAGVVTYTPIIAKAKLKYLLEDQGLQVSTVVLALDISDIKDELFYEEDRDGSIRHIPYGPQRDKAKKLEKIDKICGWLESHVERNFVILGAVVRNLRLYWRRHASVDGITVFEMLPTWAFGWPDYQGPYQKYIEQGLSEAKQSMTEIHRFLQKKKIPLILVIYPWPQQVLARSRPSRAETEWLAWGRDQGVLCINLFPLFVNSAPPQEILERYYWKNDCHWSEEGHRLVAEALLSPETGLPLPIREFPSKAKTGKKD